MTFFLHQRIFCHHFSKGMLPLICVILLTAQLSTPPCCSLTFTSPGAMALSKQRAGDPGNMPVLHCHGRVYLQLDKRYDLKPAAFFLPAPFIRPAAAMTGHPDRGYPFSCGLSAGALRLSCLRGPPGA